ncbi:MAG: BolA/IbaG family iron-sulfur metabolism protein [Bermanella sp.]
MLQDTIIKKLSAAFEVQHLEVENESHMHNVPSGSESHFKVVLVSEDFNDLNIVKQHQAVYRVLSDELAGPIHALALHTFTPDKWSKNQQALQSPDCMGGTKK